VAETLAGFEQIVWHSVVVPAKTPKTVAVKLSKELMRIMRMPDIKERLSSHGLDPVGSTPEELQALINKEIKLYARLVKDIGFQPM
jgi:tripartite-type tricarboxylate transporter receptor subunit TctC